jgi:hypothetical protein
MRDRWDDVLILIQTWVKNLEREVHTVNLWTQIFSDANEVRMVSGASVPDNQFTKDEKLIIADGLRQVKEYLVANRELTQGELAFIDAKLASLVKTAESSGRIQWLHTAIGVMVTIVIGIGLAPNETKDLLKLAGGIVASLFGGDIPLLP